MSRQRPPYGKAREALLRAAIRTVSRLGLRGMTYRAVAAEAGVSHGAVSHHFGSRSRLVEEALELSAARAVTLSSLEQRSGDLDSFLDDLTEAVAADEDSYTFQFELGLESRRDPTLRRPIAELFDLYHRAIAGELARLGLDHDPATAQMVLATLEGLIYQQITGVRSRAEVEQALERLRQALPATATPERRAGRS